MQYGKVLKLYYTLDTYNGRWITAAYTWLWASLQKWFIGFTSYPSDELQHVKCSIFIIASLSPPHKMSSCLPGNVTNQKLILMAAVLQSEAAAAAERRNVIKQTHSLTWFSESNKSPSPGNDALDKSASCMPWFHVWFLLLCKFLQTTVWMQLCKVICKVQFSWMNEFDVSINVFFASSRYWMQQRKKNGACMLPCSEWN